MKKTIYLLLAALMISGCNNNSNNENTMSNKKIVEAYMQGFNEGDHAKILALLTDDVVWDMPGFFHKVGKKEFDGEIENDAFTGKPVIKLTRLVEEGNVVVAEGGVVAQMKNGGTLDAVFCDVFIFEKNKIKQLTSYLMSRKQP
jgi:uncharacterized protein